MGVRLAVLYGTYSSRRLTPMGAFIVGLVIGAAGALLLFIYDEGEIFLKLSRQIKAVTERYKQQRAQ